MVETIRADLLLGRDTLSPGMVKAGRAAADASGNVSQLTRDLYELSKQRATPVVDLNDDKATAKLTDVTAKLKELGARVADPKVDADDKEGQAKLAAFQVKLDRLNRLVSSPRLTLDGLNRVMAELLAVNVELDKFGRKHETATVSVRQSVLSRLGGLLGGGGGIGGIAGTAGGALAIGAAIGPALVGLSQITSALAAAGAGFAAFGVAAAPTIIKINRFLSASSAKEKKAAWAALDPGQRGIVDHITALGTAFQKLTEKLEPSVLKVLDDGLKVLAALMPAIVPFARAAADALDPLLKNLAQFAKSAGFKAFVSQLAALSGPAITALGQGMGKIAVAVGKLILASAQPNSIKVLSGLLTVLAGTIDVITFVIGRASGKMVEWRNDFHDIADVVSGWSENVIHVFAVFGHDVAAAFDTARHGAATFGHDIADAFDTARHAVATAGHDIAHAFDDVRRVFASAGHSIANVFDTVRRAQGQFDAFGKDIQFVRHVVTVAFDGMRHSAAVAFDFMRHLVAATWDSIRHDTAAALAGLRHTVASVFDDIRHGIAAAWDAIWRHSQDQAQSGISGIVHWFKTLPGRAIGALFGLGHQLYAFARAALGEFWSGLKSVAGSILSWIGNFVSTIWNKVKKFFGIASPSSLFYDIGKNLMLGLFHGIRDHAHHAANAASAVAHRVGNVGSGVQRWAPLVSQALRMEGLSPSLLGNVLFQMQTESGGNPNAINLSDINAQMGDPSRGLMQVIGSTFAAYHWPGTSENIYNPLANIAAALNYARHRYGPSLMSGGQGIGSGHGYAAGSWSVPFTGPALVHRGEMIIPAVPAAAIRSGRGGGTVNNYVTIQVGHGTHPVAAAQEIAKLLNDGAKSGVKLRSSILGPG